MKLVQIRTTGSRLSTIGFARLVEALNEPCSCEGGARSDEAYQCRELEREGRPLDRGWYRWQYDGEVRKTA